MCRSHSIIQTLKIRPVSIRNRQNSLLPIAQKSLGELNILRSRTNSIKLFSPRKSLLHILR